MGRRGGLCGVVDLGSTLGLKNNELLTIHYSSAQLKLGGYGDAFTRQQLPGFRRKFCSTFAEEMTKFSVTAYAFEGSNHRRKVYDENKK